MVFLLKLVEYLIILPKRYWVKFFSFFKKERFIYICIIIAILIYAVAPIRHLIFNMRWEALLNSKQHLSIDDMMKDIVVKCGDGTSITRVVIGKEKAFQSPLSANGDNRQVLILDKAFSCNKDRTRHRNNNDCVIDINELKKINPIYGRIIPIDQETLESINSDILELGDSIYNFFEHRAIWIVLRDKEGTLTFEARDLKKRVPLFDRLMRAMREKMNVVGLVKTKNNFNDVVYVFILSFWNSRFEDDTRLCVDNLGSESRLMEELSRNQKRRF